MKIDPQTEIDKLIAEYDPLNGITIGTLIASAKENGWKPSSPFEDVSDSETTEILEPVVPKKYIFLDRNALMALPELKWRVRHVLPTRGVAAIYGPSGSGKSFLAIDLAVSICLGNDWFGKKCKSAPVVYVGLEGSAGIQNRVKAWEIGRSKQLPPNFSAVLDELDLTNDDEINAIAAQTPKGAVLIIDTLNRATPGRDENSSSDMGLILAAAKRLEHAIEGLVLLVHHTGKDQSKGLRGHSSLHAALDAAIAVAKNDKLKTKSWSVSKSKDGADQESFGFRLHSHVIGKDEDGELETSCTVEPEISSVMPSQLPEPKGSQQQPAYTAVKNLIKNSPIKGKGGATVNDSCISLVSAVKEIKKTLHTVEKSKRTYRAKKLIEFFVANGYLVSGLDENGNAWYWLPDR